MSGSILGPLLSPDCGRELQSHHSDRDIDIDSGRDIGRDIAIEFGVANVLDSDIDCDRDIGIDIASGPKLNLDIDSDPGLDPAIEPVCEAISARASAWGLRKIIVRSIYLPIRADRTITEPPSPAPGQSARGAMGRWGIGRLPTW